MMNYLYILSFISILGWTFFLSVKYKKYAAFYPLFVSTAIISVLYLGGLTKTLSFVTAIVFFLGLVLPIYGIFKLKFTLLDCKSLPLSFYFLAIVGLIWFIFTLTATIFGWDEFFWGQFTKVILITNKFYTADSAILGGKINYPPGIPLWQYFFLHFSRYIESALYFSQGILVLSAVSLIFDLVGKNVKRLFVFTLAIFSALLYFGPGLLSITNDHVLGVIFAGGVLASVYILRTNKSKLFLIPVIFALPLIKITGIILSLTIIIVALFDMLITSTYLVKKEKLKLNTIKLLIILIAILGLSAYLPMKSWDHYIKGQGAAATSSDLNWSKIKVSFSKQATEREKLTIRNFKKAVITLPMNQQEGEFQFDNPLLKFYLKIIEKINHPGLSIPIWLLIFAIPLGLIVYFNKPKERFANLSLFFVLLGGFAVYLFLHLLAYMYHFSEYEGPNLAAIGRYVSSYMLGLALITIGSMAYFMKENFKRVKLFAAVIGAIFLYLLIFHTPSFVRLIAPPKMVAKSTTAVREKTKLASDDINANTESSSKIWLIYQNTNGWECMMVRYDIVPRKMNPGDGSWSLGEKYGSEDVWTNEITIENWSQRLLDGNYNYVYLAFADDNFWDNYGDLFDNLSEAKNHKLFKVQQKDDRVLLIAK